MKLFKKATLFLLTAAIILSMAMVFENNTAIKADAATHPYPKLLDYIDLNSSFNSLAASKILPQYRDYVLESIKYHIESSTDDYRVAKNIMQAYNANKDGNVLFFFDGCSLNLDGATACFSGYKKNGNRYNMSAVAIVVQKNSAGRAQIMFATKNASTSPDNVRNASLNGGNPPGSLRDGIYNFQTCIHGSYAGFNVITTANSHVRACTYKSSYISQASGINIHRRGYTFDYITDSTCNSTGCFNIGGASTDKTEYNNFVKTITGYSNGGSGYSGYATYVIKGITIIDRSNYKTSLATVYGNDSNWGISNGWTGTKIAEQITVGSASWNSDVNNRLVASFSTVPGTPIKVDLTNKFITAISPYTTVDTLKAQFKNPDRMTVKNASGTAISGSTQLATGCTVSDTDAKGNTTTVTVVVWSDADGDGKVTVNDYTKIKTCFKKSTTLSGAYLKAADVTGNGKLTVSDYLLIKRYVAGTYKL